MEYITSIYPLKKLSKMLLALQILGTCTILFLALIAVDEMEHGELVFKGHWSKVVALLFTITLLAFQTAKAQDSLTLWDTIQEDMQIVETGESFSNDLRDIMKENNIDLREATEETGLADFASLMHGPYEISLLNLKKAAKAIGGKIYKSGKVWSIIKKD